VSGEPRIETLHAGFGFAEGPVILPDGAIAFCDGTNGLVLGLHEGRVTTIGAVGGSPNGLALGSDGALYVAQMGSLPGVLPLVPPSVQRLTLDGRVTTVAADADGRPLVAPNDLAFGPDGLLYVTESGDPDYLNPVLPGRIFVISDTRVDQVLELAPCFTNGICFDAEDRLIWTETATRRVCRLDGDSVEVLAILPETSIPDGLAVGADGRLFVATVTSGGITVLSAEGELLDHVAVGAEPTNCAFDGARLVVTAFTPGTEPPDGHLLAFETDTTGLALQAGTLQR